VVEVSKPGTVYRYNVFGSSNHGFVCCWFGSVPDSKLKRRSYPPGGGFADAVNGQQQIRVAFYFPQMRQIMNASAGDFLHELFRRAVLVLHAASK
jgi:hypothetical protein